MGQQYIQILLYGQGLEGLQSRAEVGVPGTGQGG